MRFARPASGSLLPLVLAMLCTIAGAVPARAQDDPVAGRIGATIAGIEWLLGRNGRCERRLPLVERRIAEAELDPVANATLLTELRARRDTHARCIEATRERLDLQQPALENLARQFVETTRVDPAMLDGHIGRLHEREAVHTARQYTLRQAQAGLSRLRAAEPPDPVRIAQKEAVVQTVTEELAAAVAAVAEANRALADLEQELALANATGSARLSWAVPTTRENGDPLAPGELGGFEIYVLSESTGESAVITVQDPLATSYEVDRLAPDTYYFSIAAFDIEGKFSQLSEVVSKLVP